MTDRREVILARLVVIAQGIANIKTVTRNRLLVDDDELPAIQIFDSDEHGDDQDPKQRPAFAPRRVALAPEIYISIAKTDGEELGPALNVFRSAFLKAILTDSELITAVGTNGDIRFEACATALSRGRSLQGEMGLSISFVYILKASEL